MLIKFTKVSGGGPCQFVVRRTYSGISRGSSGPAGEPTSSLDKIQWTVDGDKTWKPWEKNFEGMNISKRTSVLELWTEYWRGVRWQNGHEWMRDEKVTRRRREHGPAIPGLRWAVNDNNEKSTSNITPSMRNQRSDA